MSSTSPLPLYIDPGPVTVRTRDHALLLVRPGRAEAAFPPARIERVVSPRTADWRHDALALIMDRGIPIHWSHPGRGLTGTLLPASAEPPPLAAQLDAFLRHAEWQTRLDGWIRHVRTAQFRRWTREKMLSKRIHRDQLRRDWIPNGNHPCPFDAETRAWVHAWLTSFLPRHDLPHLAATGDGTPLDITDLFVPFLWAELNLTQSLRHNTPELDDRQTRIGLVERWLHTRHDLATDIIRSFVQFLLHQSRPWL